MKVTRQRLRQIIKEELGSIVTGREKGMQISKHPPTGMTGLQVGDVVYLTPDAYGDADIHRWGNDWPPVTVTELGNVEDLHGTTVPAQTDPPSDWDWVAGATGPGFVGEYETAPGMGDHEDLVFPMDAIDWEYTKRGPKEPWAMPPGPGMFAGGGTTTEARSLLDVLGLRKTSK